MKKEKQKVVQVFGYHMLLDFHGCLKKKTESIDVVYDFLDDITRLLKMHQQAPPFVKKKKNIGISGWVPIVESGISINTNITRGYASIDIYSCKKFNKSQVKKFAAKIFCPKKINEQYVLRGKEYVA